MLRFTRITGGALALGAALALSAPASWAQAPAPSGVLTSSPVGCGVAGLPACGPTGPSTNPFATQAVAANSGVVQIPAVVNVAYTATSSVTGNVNVTFTLPPGVTFTSTPSATTPGVGNGFSGASFVSGGAGSNNVTYSVTATAGTPGTLTLGNFGLQGAGSLGTPVTTSASGSNNGFAITAAVSSPAGSNLKGAPGSTGLANSVSALSFATAIPTTAGFTCLAIDVGPNGLAKKFIQGGAGCPLTGADTLVADLGASVLGTVPTIDANDVPFSFGGSAATLTINGNFSNIASAYLAPVGTTTCASPPPAGVINGTVTASAITFAGVPAPGAGATNTQEVCIQANGTGVIGANPTGYTASATIGGTTVSLAAPTNLVPYSYNGVQQPILYSGDIAGYPMFVRIVNNSGNTATVLALVQTEGGSNGVATVATVPNGNNLLVSASSIVSASGVVPDSSGRVSMRLLSQFGVAFSQLLLNPTGDVVQLGSGLSP